MLGMRKFEKWVLLTWLTLTRLECHCHKAISVSISSRICGCVRERCSQFRHSRLGQHAGLDICLSFVSSVHHSVALDVESLWGLATANSPRGSQPMSSQLSSTMWVTGMLSGIARMDIYVIWSASGDLNKTRHLKRLII
jgi:hypothetical protein